MRLGFFSFPRLVHGGGFETYLVTVANALSARGHDVSIVTANASSYRLLQHALNVYYRNPPGHDNSRLTANELRSRLDGPILHEVPISRMTRLLRGHDVIYSKNELLDLTCIAAFRLRRLPPVICGVHTPMWYPRAVSTTARIHNRLYLGSPFRALLRGVAAVHVSNAHDRTFFQQVHGVDSADVFQIPYPFDVAASSGTKPPTGLPLRVVFAARLTEQKGTDVLLDVIASLNRNGTSGSFHFTIAGSGEPELEEQMRSAAERYENVQYLGHVPHERMAALYDDAHIAFVPSNWETFPYSCLEPQSQGVPVVATDIPGCQDIVSHGETGFLFPVGDSEAAAAILKQIEAQLIHAPHELTRLGCRAEQSVRYQSDHAAVVTALERMFEQVALAGAK